MHLRKGRVLRVVFNESDCEEDRVKDKIIVRNKMYYRYSTN